MIRMRNFFFFEGDHFFQIVLCERREARIKNSELEENIKSPSRRYVPHKPSILISYIHCTRWSRTQIIILDQEKSWKS